MHIRTSLPRLRAGRCKAQQTSRACGVRIMSIVAVVEESLSPFWGRHTQRVYRRRLHILLPATTNQPHASESRDVGSVPTTMTYLQNVLDSAYQATMPSLSFADALWRNDTPSIARRAGIHTGKENRSKYICITEQPNMNTTRVPPGTQPFAGSEDPTFFSIWVTNKLINIRCSVRPIRSATVTARSYPRLQSNAGLSVFFDAI